MWGRSLINWVMTTSFWTGTRVRLRGVEPSDWDTFMRFDQHSGHQRSGEAVLPPRSAEGYRGWAKERSTAKPEEDCFQLAIEAVGGPGQAVGIINTYDADPCAGHFRYGISIGAEHQGQGFATEAAVILMRYMFAERRYHKCEVDIYGYNEASLALHRRLGFTEEGRRREHAFLAGAYHDLVAMGLLADEFAELHSLGGL
ncbi:Putative acetyltransferase (plasmid) [Streptomyces clavuligerus]|uniref:Putative acetyltransferase n=2 Tax=Streptomyces clavuligerus TaxID=1901 RepID=D5SKA0_STRCL|nr:Putative acetyltransferase [Streptomyces clavuligerus]